MEEVAVGTPVQCCHENNPCCTPEIDSFSEKDITVDQASMNGTLHVELSCKTWGSVMVDQNDQVWDEWIGEWVSTYQGWYGWVSHTLQLDCDADLATDENPQAGWRTETWIKAETSKCENRELLCATLEDVYEAWNTDETELSLDCSWNINDGKHCNVTCVDTGLQASPFLLKCDENFEIQPQQKPTCPVNTECGSTATWNYGTSWSDVSVSCSEVDDTEVCSLSCSAGLFPYPVDFVKCEDKVLIPCPVGADPLDPTGGMEISCEVTPCGNIGQFGFDDTEMTASCDENGCTFECIDATLMPNTKSIVCNPNSKQWVNEFEMAATDRHLQCVEKITTPCGNLEDHAELVNTVDVECESFNSIFETSKSTCQIDCGAKFTKGPEEYICEDNTFKSLPAKTECCDRACCGLDQFADYAELMTKVTEVDYENHIASFSCLDDEQVLVDPTTNLTIDNRIECNRYSHEWDVDAFNSLVAAECRTLPCTDDHEVIALLKSLVDQDSGASLDCSGGSCTVSCSLAEKPIPLPQQVNCDNLQETLTSEIKCAETKCGNTIDFNYGAKWPSVDVACDNDTGVCNLSCTSGYIYPIDEISCNDGVLTPSAENLEIFCAETVCGDMDSQFIYDESVFTKDCNETSCTLACVDTSLIPTQSVFHCAENSLRFTNQHGAREISNPNAFRVLECVEDRETPCGNLSDWYYVDPRANVTCDSFESIWMQSQHRFDCEIECPAGLEVFGAKRKTCRGNLFAKQDENPVAQTFACWDPETEDTMCGKISDYFPNIDQNIKWECSQMYDQFESPVYCHPSCETGVLSTEYRLTCDIDNAQYSAWSSGTPSFWYNAVAEDSNIVMSCQNTAPDECGQLSDAFTIDQAVNQNCVYDNHPTSTDSTCSLSCPEGLFTTEVSQIKCKNGAWVPISINNAIECAETKCGDPESWNFGVDFKNITASCSHNEGTSTCALSCEIDGNAGFVIDSSKNIISDITCLADRTISPNQGSVNLKCAETPCGSISAAMTIDAEVTVACTSEGCDFTCPAGKMPTHISIECKDGEYQHYANSDTVVIQCVPEKETPCGDVADYFTISDYPVSGMG